MLRIRAEITNRAVGIVGPTIPKCLNISLRYLHCQHHSKRRRRFHRSSRDPDSLITPRVEGRIKSDRRMDQPSAVSGGGRVCACVCVRLMRAGESEMSF